MSISQRVIIVIPARMASTRLPGKPLALIAGEPMIVHVWRRALASTVGPVVVACAEREIAHAIESVGGKAVMTDPDLPSGSDRVSAALEAADPNGHYAIVVNLQGDLPALDPAIIHTALVPLQNHNVDIATLATVIGDEDERRDPNVVKIALSLAANASVGRALYFSREPIPWGDGPAYHHIGLYAYRRNALSRFVTMPPGVLERRERLEQLRALENGMRIDAALVSTVPFGVDTPSDLERARRLIEEGRR